MFKITRKGIYTVPGWGRLDATQKMEVPPAKMVELYLLKGFPWIEIERTDASLKAFKKLKLTNAQLSRMILQARNADDVGFLVQLTDNKAIQKIADTRVSALKKR